MGFLHAFYKLIMEPPAENKFLREFKLMKIKMKLNYEAKQSQINLSHMFQLAIFKTLLEKQRMAAAELQQSLRLDSQAFHSIFYRSVDLRTNSLREPTNDEQIDRLTGLLQHHTKNISINTTLQKLEIGTNEFKLDANDRQIAHSHSLKPKSFRQSSMFTSPGRNQVTNNTSVHNLSSFGSPRPIIGQSKK